MKKTNSLISKVTKFFAVTCLLAVGCSALAREADEFLVYKYTHTYTAHEYGPGERNVEKGKEENFLIWNLRSNEYSLIVLNDGQTFAKGISTVWNWSEVIIDKNNKKYSVLSFNGVPNEIQNEAIAYTDTMSSPLQLRAIESGPHPKMLDISKVYRGRGQVEEAVEQVRWRSWTEFTNHMLLSDLYTKRVNDKKPRRVDDARDLVMQFLEEEGWTFRNTTGQER